LGFFKNPIRNQRPPNAKALLTLLKSDPISKIHLELAFNICFLIFAIEDSKPARRCKLNQHKFVHYLHLVGAHHKFVGAHHKFVGAHLKFVGAHHNFVGAHYNFAHQNFVGA
jgi:hypothetical protein